MYFFFFKINANKENSNTHDMGNEDCKTYPTNIPTSFQDK